MKSHVITGFLNTNPVMRTEFNLHRLISTLISCIIYSANPIPRCVRHLTQSDEIQ